MDLLIIGLMSLPNSFVYMQVRGAIWPGSGLSIGH